MRMGTTDPFDSMNPFVAFQAISYVAFTNVYPTLVQYDTHFKIIGDWAKSWKTSKDGLTWTFTLKPGKWSDGKPLTADDAAWTGNTILKFAKGPAASLAPFISHATKLTAPNPSTLVIHYNKAVANVLPQLQQFFVLPRHVWEPVVGTAAKGLKDYDPAAHLPIVGGGSFFVQKYDKKGTTILARNPGFYGPRPHVDAVGITWFANSDAMLAALKSNGLDYVDSVPPTVASTLGKSGDIQVVKGRGSEVRDFAFNSSPKKKKNRELLDPKVRDALSHAFDRKQIIDVVFRGLADPRATLLTPLSTPYMNTDLQPEKYDLALANGMLDKLGYKRGSDGIRRTPGSELASDVLRRDHADERVRHQPRVRDRARLVREDRRQAHPARLRRHHGIRRDHEAEEQVSRLRHDDVGLGRLRRSRLRPLRGRLRPVRRLERHRLLQPGIRQALPAAGRHTDPEKRQRSCGGCRRSSTATSRTSSSRS